MIRKAKVLDHGHVSLEAFGPILDPELMVVNSARVSFDNYKDKIELEDEKLIEFLLKNRHGTPFEMVEFWFHVKCPIFVTREWHRHRIASYNEMSARYTELPREFYVPKGKDIRYLKGKQSDYTYGAMDDCQILEWAHVDFKEANTRAWNAYQEMLKMGIAKEVARMVLPVNIYTQFYYKTNARSLMNFLSLRNHPKAMWEIRQYAKAIENMFHQVMPITHEAFIKHGRTAP
jgi:thymidylate synthase (FAD)